MMNIPWIDYYLGLAFLISQRSKDSQTQHGCIITTKQHVPLGFGYNSFPRKMQDDTLPNTRPDKYLWMIHSERNALNNCMISPHVIPDGCVAYITGQPCHNCAMDLYQNNVDTFYIANRKGTALESQETAKAFQILVEQGKIKVYYVVPDLSWIAASQEKFNNIEWIK